MLLALDLIGTFVFALSGALKAARHRLDWLGVTVLATLTGVGGGMVRDVLLGATPPAVFSDERFFLACLLGAVAVIVAAPTVARRWNRVMLADAVGLGLFAALGAAKGAAHGLGPIGVVLMGALTAVGGGVIRDVLVGERPAVLDRGFYATAALLGAGAFVALRAAGAAEPPALLAAAGVCTGLRLAAMARRARLPRTALPPTP